MILERNICIYIYALIYTINPLSKGCPVKVWNDRAMMDGGGVFRQDKEDSISSDLQRGSNRNFLKYGMGEA